MRLNGYGGFIERANEYCLLLRKYVSKYVVAQKDGALMFEYIKLFLQIFVLCELVEKWGTATRAVLSLGAQIFGNSNKFPRSVKPK